MCLRVCVCLCVCACAYIKSWKNCTFKECVSTEGLSWLGTLSIHYYCYKKPKKSTVCASGLQEEWTKAVQFYESTLALQPTFRPASDRLRAVLCQGHIPEAMPAAGSSP